MSINEVERVMVVNKVVQIKDLVAGMHIVECGRSYGLIVKQGDTNGEGLEDVEQRGLLIAWEDGMYCTLKQTMLDGTYDRDHNVIRIGVLNSASGLFSKGMGLKDIATWLWKREELKPILELTIKEIAGKYDVDVSQIKIVEVK